MQNSADLFIPRTDADKLIAEGDGDMALLYLYLRRRKGGAEEAAQALSLSESRVFSAFEGLERLGISVPRASSKKLPGEELPEYTADEISARSREDGAFKAIVSETQAILGRCLSGADLRILFGIYDYLAMPPEVILMLLHFCVDKYAIKYGPGRLPSMRAIEKEAYAWANEEILTLEQAEEHIKQYRNRRNVIGRAKEALGIRGRELTATELRYINEWLALGFEAEALELAYDRTVTNTGSLKWPYMNKILLSWNEKGLHTPEEIFQKDKAAPRQPSSPVPAGRSAAQSLSALENKIKKTGR